MSDISPEDRERLVDLRFAELFNRHMERGFADAFDRRLMEWAEIAGGQATQPPRGAAPAPRQQPAGSENHPSRRRNLLEIAMSDMLGIG